MAPDTQGAGGAAKAAGRRLPPLLLRERALQAKDLALDVYEESFLGGFLHGGIGCKTGAGCSESCTPRGEQRGTHRLLFDGMQGAMAEWRPPGDSRVPEAADDGGGGAKRQRGATSAAPGRADALEREERRHVRTITSRSVASLAAAQYGRDLRKHEACESLRTLVFGCVGNEEAAPSDRAKVFKQRRGTLHEVSLLVKLWSQLDDECRGDIGFAEFAQHFKTHSADRLSGMRCVRHLVSSAEAPGDGDASPAAFQRQVSAGRQRCTKEDMMRLMWLGATDEDVAVMTLMFELARLQQVSVPPPPLLSKRRRRELFENFKEMDRKGVGCVPYSDLVDAGMVDEAVAKEFQEKYDHDRDGTFDFDEFLEMLCPDGYRAHGNVGEVMCRDGRTVRLVQWECSEGQFEGWLPETESHAADLA